MKARPILFSGERVRDILDGRKTQTRRIIKPQPFLSEHLGFCWKGFAYGIGSDDAGTQRNFTRADCPYGKLGDLLWVRETCMEWEGKARDVVYRADIDGGAWEDLRADLNSGFPWKIRPSIHMPRWASRLTLEITNVRVERLQSITPAECRAEGIAPYDGGWTNGLLGPFSDPRLAFADLWDSTGGDWSSNPWVWVIEFKPIMANVDEVLRERQEAA